MEELPRISIITPSYNQGRFIERTILSVKNQGYRNYEHIIVDGGSTDETHEVIKKYPEIVYIEKKSSNGEIRDIGFKLNIGFKKASGEIIGWIASDDEYTPEAFQIVAKYLMHHPNVDFVYSDCVFIDENDRIVGNWKTSRFDYFRNLNYAQMIPQPTMFFRRRVFDKIGYVDEELSYAIDFDFFIRIAKKCIIMYMPGVVLARFRLHSASKTVSQRKKFDPELAIVKRRHGAIIPHFISKIFNNLIGVVKKRPQI